MALNTDEEVNSISGGKIVSEGKKAYTSKDKLPRLMKGDLKLSYVK